MPNKVRSIFLLTLFTLVILFPGYSQNVRKKAGVKSFVLTETEHISNLEAMFKKCLSCGIANSGPVNEETPSSSTSEERADHGEESPIDEFALNGWMLQMSQQFVVLCFIYEQHMPPITVADIATPPPDCIFLS
jgi:hypothetical protein